MPHHIHALLFVPRGMTISQLMNRIKANSARRFRPRLDRELSPKFSDQTGLNGNVFWQSGFRSVEVRSEKVMLQKLRYIHANPVRARLVEREEDYRWSSARLRIAVRLDGTVLAIDDAMIEEFGNRALLSLRRLQAEATGTNSETLDP